MNQTKQVILAVLLIFPLLSEASCQILHHKKNFYQGFHVFPPPTPPNFLCGYTQLSILSWERMECADQSMSSASANYKLPRY